MKIRISNKVINKLEELSYLKGLDTNNKEIIKSLLISLEAKDGLTLEHSIRVGKYGYRIAKMMNLSDCICEEIQVAGILHDIGKIGITSDILKKPDKLTNEEFDKVKEHPVLGYKILSNLGFSDVILNAVRFHHKRYDLRGYPNRVKLVEEPIEASIIGVADAFDAMISNRVYKKALTVRQAIEELEINKKGQFHPKIVDVFIEDLYNSLDHHINKQKI
ncbi:HD-GYP domain-containing protein [Sporosalibacterium faouarense]|uniref:HD-GYP domain-containing protein n=1 Tax=Sporosalibacterium faouarense TaxID=516123 RepID=UPI00141D6F82|nr:HD domain-containing phosphohydrolase [Sporosalibacterium faouarense]MTI47587.1 HD domain-containing protein [Bacillota bacterium]